MKETLALVLVCGVLAACASDASKEGPAMTIELTSPAFAGGQPIPKKHTCEGSDVSPPLQWASVPEGVKSFALVCDDPDAPMGTWVHWVLYDIPAGARELGENVPKKPALDNGARQGANDSRRPGYGGPCPPPGNPHRYFFTLYALDAMLSLEEGATKKDVDKAMRGHILAQGQLMGTYKR